MTCLHDGILRAYLDQQLPDSESAGVKEHLGSCPDCRLRLEKIRAEMARTRDLLGTLSTSEDRSEANASSAYARFIRSAPDVQLSWPARLFRSRWRAAWGVAAAAVVIAILLSVNPVRTWAQRILAMLRVEKIAVVSIDPSTLVSSSQPDSRPYKLINQFIADNVVVTLDPGKADQAPNLAKARQLAGYRILGLSRLGEPRRIEVRGETAFQMTIERDRIETLLDALGRSDIPIPESINGALVAVQIPKTVLSLYGDCPDRHRDMAHQNRNTGCTYLLQAPSPTVSVPPDLNMAEIAEAALQLAGMSPGEAHAFCQTVDWSSTLVVPVPRNTSSYETVTVDGVEGALITESALEGNRYSLLWIKDGMIHSLAGYGSSADALTLAASLR
jgi:hypothetical protein